MARTRTFRTLIPIALSVVLASCGSDEGAAPSATEGPETTASAEVSWPADVGDVFRRAEETLAAMGVGHVTGEVTSRGAAEYTGTVEMWLDATGDRYREDVSATGRYVDEDRPLSWDATEIGLADGTWRASGPVSPVRCHGVGVAASHLLGCRRPTEVSNTTLERGDPIDGVPVVVLVTSGEESGSDSTTTYTTRLYVDAESGLPIRSDTEGSVDTGVLHELSTTVEYQHEALDPATLDADHFDPAAMGWDTSGPIAHLPTDEAVAWLGERWEPGDGLPTVVLTRVEQPEIDEGLYHATLTYTDETDRYGAPVLLIYSWDRAAWDSVIRRIPPCERHTVNGLEVQLQCGPDGGVVSATVVDGDRIAEISAPTTSSATGSTPSPFSGADALLQVASALSWHEPQPGG